MHLYLAVRCFKIPYAEAGVPTYIRTSSEPLSFEFENAPNEELLRECIEMNNLVELVWCSTLCKRSDRGQ